MIQPVSNGLTSAVDAKAIWISTLKRANDSARAFNPALKPLV
jgi:hypothetical protein